MAWQSRWRVTTKVDIQQPQLILKWILDARVIDTYHINDLLKGDSKS